MWMSFVARRRLQNFRVGKWEEETMEEKGKLRILKKKKMCSKEAEYFDAIYKIKISRNFSTIFNDEEEIRIRILKNIGWLNPMREFDTKSFNRGIIFLYKKEK